MTNHEIKVEVSRLNRMDGNGRTKAYADVTFADAILVKGIRVVSGQKGLFVSMPRKKGKDGNWYETVRPIDNSLREKISGAVLVAYNDSEDPVAYEDPTEQVEFEA